LLVKFGESHPRLLVELIKHRDKVFSRQFSKVIYSIPDKNMDVNADVIKALQESFPNLQVETEFSTPEKWGLIPNFQKENILICIEDQYARLSASKDFSELLTIHSHHHNISVICSTQNYFTNSKISTTLLRQYTYIGMENGDVRHYV
jgi:hypothetical protein